jgi:putative ABC transport system ATP-binding protein
MTAQPYAESTPDASRETKQFIQLSGVSKRFPLGVGEFTALRDVSLSVRPGESIAITGRSGSGKSTLLNLVTGIDRPSSGTISVGGTPLQDLSENALTAWRGRTVGIVFQFFQLLPTLSVVDNVLLAMDFVNVIPDRERHDRAMQLLDRVGLQAHATKAPGALSGGELQRAAVARALANDPPLLVADEPTGNLDSRTGGMIVDLLRELVDGGRTLLLITHDLEVAARLGRMVTIADGAIERDSSRADA